LDKIEKFATKQEFNHDENNNIKITINNKLYIDIDIDNSINHITDYLKILLIRNEFDKDYDKYDNKNFNKLNLELIIKLL
jgi:hypothetical protein